MRVICIEVSGLGDLQISQLYKRRLQQRTFNVRYFAVACIIRVLPSLPHHLVPRVLTSAEHTTPHSNVMYISAANN